MPDFRDYYDRGVEKERKLSIECDLCYGHRLLWLGGNDYVECPNCVKGKVEVIETTVRPRRYF